MPELTSGLIHVLQHPEMFVLSTAPGGDRMIQPPHRPKKTHLQHAGWWTPLVTDWQSDAQRRSSPRLNSQPAGVPHRRLHTSE